MTTAQIAARASYIEKSIESIYIDMDSQGCYAKVESQHHGVTYTVRINERGAVPAAAKCNCSSRKYCKHMEVVDTFYGRIYNRTTVQVTSIPAQAVTSVEQEVPGWMLNPQRGFSEPRRASAA